MVLEMTIHCSHCHAYMDVANPLPYLENAVLLSSSSNNGNDTTMILFGSSMIIDIEINTR